MTATPTPGRTTVIAATRMREMRRRSLIRRQGLHKYFLAGTLIFDEMPGKTHMFSGADGWSLKFSCTA